MSTYVGCGPLYRVDGPLPLAPRFGLLQAAAAPAAGVQVIPEGDEHFLNGVELYPYPQSGGAAWDANSTGTDRLKSFGEDRATDTYPIFGPMTAYLAETCFSRRVWSQEEYRNRAVVAFEAVESSIVAREFASGAAVANNPHLCDGGGSFPNGDTVTSVRDGIALLESYLGGTGKFGLIHVPPGILSGFREPWAIDKSTGVVRTLNDNVVIPDAGYTNTNDAPVVPLGHAAPAEPSQAWLFATGPIDVRRSEVFILPERIEQALDRGTPGSATNGRSNQITYRVERYYAVDWDNAVQAAVLVDWCDDSCARGT